MFKYSLFCELEISQESSYLIPYSNKTKVSEILSLSNVKCQIEKTQCILFHFPCIENLPKKVNPPNFIILKF
jgi:hypothetical protein